MSDQDFLDDLNDEADAAEGVQAPVAEQEPVAVEQPAEPVAQEPAPPEPKPEPQHVPITALLDERDKRKAMEAELERLRAAQAPQPEFTIPDMFEDPDGYSNYQQQVAQQATLNAKLDISEEMARDKFGDEEVETAKNWALQQFAARPGFQQEVLRQRNPYRFVVEQYKREQIATQVTPDDFAQYQAWKAAQSQLQAPATPAPVAPPRSLATAPSAGSISTEPVQTDEEMFKEIIG